MFLALTLYPLLAVLAFVAIFYILRRTAPLSYLASPRLIRGYMGHLEHVLDPSISRRAHEVYVKKYGRSLRIQGIGPWDQRLLTLDPVSVNHVLRHTILYEKPWQTRTLIQGLIGCGMLAAEGHVHKRQRRVSTPAFSIQNLRAVIPVVFHKGCALRDRLSEVISEATAESVNPASPHRLDVAHWVSRATFDVIGVAGFDYEFNAIRDESNELFLAYKEMFEVSLSQSSPWMSLFRIYFSWLNKAFPDEPRRTITKSHKVIHEVAGQLIKDKKAKIAEGSRCGVPYAGKDLLTLLIKSNNATDLPAEHRISDEDILNNINTFLFAGSDTSSLTVSWTLYLLSQDVPAQERLRNELLAAFPAERARSIDLTEDEIQSLYQIIADLPHLHNVIRESLRLIPPVHSTVRIAMQDDEIPTGFPVHHADGSVHQGEAIHIKKGTFVHVAIEGFNLDKHFWGDDAWEFRPDRWDNLPDQVKSLPGLLSNTLTFSAGPRSCIGMRFSMIEIKWFLYILLTSFEFRPTQDPIIKANVALTRPYLANDFKAGSQLPLMVFPLLSNKTIN